MALLSPGVEVTITDETFGASPNQGTIPLIVFATEENKPNQTGTGIAPGTTPDNAGQLFLISSQRELIQQFGEPIFKNFQGTPQHGNELNEYGLFSAYSYLGIANRVYGIRADVPLSELEPLESEPSSDPANGTYWLDLSATDWGVFQNNGATTPGLAWEKVEPLVISDESLIDTSSAPEAPASFVGQNGEFAIVIPTDIENGPSYQIGLWEKIDDVWYLVGSDGWQAATPTTATGTAGATASTGGNLVINGQTVTVTSGDGTDDVANAINTASIPDINASAGSPPSPAEPLTIENVAGGNIDMTGSNSTLLTDFGLPSGIVNGNTLFYASNTNVPSDYAAGDVWVKTTNPNGGADWVVKQYNVDLDQFVLNSAPLFDTVQQASAALGTNIPAGTLIVLYDLAEEGEGTFQLRRWNGQGTLSVIGNIKGPSVIPGDQFDINGTTITINNSTVESVVQAINNAGITNVRAERVNVVGGAGNIKITNTNGGALELINVVGTPLDDMGLEEGIFSNWLLLNTFAGLSAPTSPPQEGRLWYDASFEVDILVSDGQEWFGYNNFYPESDIILSASRPTTQRDGTPLEGNDLWIDTSDLENYPVIRRWNPSTNRWVLVDKTDQSSPFGIVFGDVRPNTGPDPVSYPSNPGGPVADQTVGALSTDEIAMRYSNFVDPDAPSPLTFPAGMLAFNTRYSTQVVREWRPNYFDETGDGFRFLEDTGDYDVGAANFTAQDLQDTGLGRWVTASGNRVDGSPYMGRQAQRIMIVRAIASVLIENQDIRSEEIFFNLISCPGYPELIDEMVTLNVDKKQWAFIVADTPARLEPNSTAILQWATNANNAPGNGDEGLVTRDPYVGVYYPWGLSTNVDGSEIVVPPSTMALRTMAFNDQVAYQWFAPAGFNRGLVNNASAVGYITSEEEFQPVSLGQGLRDTLFQNDVNPIAFIPNRGLVVFGQNTLNPVDSALSKINVARLTNYLRYNLDLLAKPFLFEPNDQETRDSIQTVFERFLGDLVGLRALEDFAVISDETNNTPARINRNELWVDVAIIPVKAVEFIFIPIRLLNTGDELP